MILVSSCSCPCPSYWSRVLNSEWRCSWSRQAASEWSTIQLPTKVRLILETWRYMLFSMYLKMECPIIVCLNKAMLFRFTVTCRLPPNSGGWEQNYTSFMALICYIVNGFSKNMQAFSLGDLTILCHHTTMHMYIALYKSIDQCKINLFHLIYT